ncbi:tripartite tricarboxylate transporter permease [Dysosmobacter sp. Marseille-Q4140]|nr:tripartite tricarboxylate transporter permease [Dysosmobacter sp. Marseille-Q4140]
MEYILPALQIVCTPHGLAVIFLGALFGILCGAMPGLSSIMAMTILMPFTFSLDGLYGILMLLGVFCGSVYGGSITAILINTPGTANAAATCLDGYPMAQKGQPDRAISISTSASCFGGLFGSFCLLFTAPLLASVSIKFGVTEYFALGIFGLSIVTGVSSKSVIKGVLGAILGLLLGTVGIDTLSATFRYTFDITYLVAGVAFVPLLIGLYALAQCFTTSEGDLDEMTRGRNVKLKQILPSRHDIKRCTPVVLGCSVLGTIIGAIPGTGGDIASWVGYNEAKRWVKKNEVPFGEGTPEGIAAPESANNAIVGGALIPLLTLGIPGDAGTALLLGALMLQGITPGPLLFTNQGEKVYTIIVGLFMANIAFAILGFCGIRIFAKIGNLPQKWLTPLIFTFCTVGTFALNNNFGDVIFMLIAGILGYFLLKLDFSMPPIILGLLLGETVESNLRRAMTLSGGDLGYFLTRPIAMVLLVISAISLFYPIIVPAISRHNAKRAAQKQNAQADR